MALCANIYRRGGVYWWRRRLRFGSGSRSCYVQISLGVRDPDFARRLGRLVGVEADRIASLVRAKMLGPAQQRDLLKRFIKEQVAALDQVAIKNTTKPVDEDGPLYDMVFSHSRMERLLLAVFDILAAGGVGAQLQDHDRVRLGAEGLGADDIQEIADLVAEFAPAYATFGNGVATEGRTTVGPDYQFFSGVLREMGIAITLQTVEHARRLWFRAQAVALADVNRRYGLRPAHVEKLYEAVVDEDDELVATPTATGKPVRPAGVATASLGRPTSVQSFPPIELDPPIAVGAQELSHALVRRQREWDKTGRFVRGGFLAHHS